MIIRTNMFAVRTLRERNKTTGAAAKNLEKLSSGLRINRASDDAAGLSISEKIRANVTELERCQSNVTEGMDLAQTADAALQEVNDMLRRAGGLCIEAANGTYSDQEREAISDELNQLFGEIDRITASSTFNTIPLFRGDIKTDETEDQYRTVYDETFTTLGPDQLERWGKMEFVKDKEFDTAEAAEPATVAFKLAGNISPSDSSEVLEGKSIVIAGSTYRFTKDPSGIPDGTAINLNNYTTVKDAVEALAAVSFSISKAEVGDDGSVKLTAALRSWTLDITADGETAKYTVSNGNGEYYNNKTVQNPLRDQILGQVDGSGNINNPVKYSTSEIDLDISKLPDTLTEDDVKNLKNNSLYIVSSYAGSDSYFGATIPLSELGISKGATREEVAGQIAKTVNAYTSNNGFTYTAEYNSDGKFLNITVSQDGYDGPIEVSMLELKPPSESYTTVYDPDPNHSWTSTAFSVGFTSTNRGSGPERRTELKITIPQMPSEPFSFVLDGKTYLYYNSKNYPLTSGEFDQTSYTNISDYSKFELIPTDDMSSNAFQDDIIEKIINHYNTYVSGISQISTEGNTITITSQAGHDLPSNCPVSGLNIGVTPYKNEKTTTGPETPYMLTNGSWQDFHQEIYFSFNLSEGISSLAGKGFSIYTDDAIDGQFYQYFEFTNGSGSGVSSDYTDIDISDCTTVEDLVAKVKEKLTSSYNVSVSDDNENELKISVERNSRYSIYVTDGADGIVSEGSVVFSGGKNAGRPEAALDFSSINESNLDTLLGKGFRITCATCEGEYINIFFCWEDDGTLPHEFQRLDENTGEMRTIHNIPVELSKVTNGEKIVESIVNQVQPTLTHYTEIAIGDPVTTLVARDKRPGNIAGYQAQIQTGVETNFTYRVEITQEKVKDPSKPDDDVLRLNYAKVLIYAGAGMDMEKSSAQEPWYIPVHLPYIDLKSLQLNPPEFVDLNADDQDASDWLNRVKQANISIADARGTIGADYNRLEHALQALSESDVELTDAESRIRDADIAELMMENVKFQILTQSQQAMLVQSHTLPQQVLQMLM